MPQFGRRSDPLLGDGVARADADRDSPLGIDRLEAVLVREIVADKDRPAPEIGRLVQERLDDFPLARRRGQNFGHRLAELDPILRPQAFKCRVRRRDAEFLLVRGLSPVQRHRTALVLDEKARLVADDLV